MFNLALVNFECFQYQFKFQPSAVQDNSDAQSRANPAEHLLLHTYHKDTAKSH